MCEIKIDQVVFYPIRPTSHGLIGFASCQFGNRLALNCIAVYTRPSGVGIRCVFPEKTLPNGLKVNVFHPINDEARTAIEDAINLKIQEVAKQVMEDEV